MADGRSYQFGRFRLDASGRVLYRGGQAVALPPKAADTLLLLVQRAGQVVGRDDLLKQVWCDSIVEEGSLTRTISILRRALQDGSHQHQYIATVSKRGYRLVAPVRQTQSDASGASEKLVLAVLPFENLSGNPKQEYFSDGLTEEMITEAGRLNPQRLAVIARTSAMKYKGSRKSIRQIGRELRVSHVLEGSVRRERGRVRIAAQLIQVSDQTHVWAETYDRSLRDILKLQAEVACAIAEQIEVRLAPNERTRLNAVGVVNPAAHEAYLKGRYLCNKRTEEALRASIRHFEKAIAFEPRYAAAYAGLADTYLTLHDVGLLPPAQAMAKAKAAAAAALTRDQTLAEPHISLAHAHFHELHWTSAVEEFQRGIELNPNYAAGHFYYANYLLAAGSTSQAIVEARRAKALDPVSLPAETNLSSILYHAGEYALTIEHARSALDTEPGFVPAWEDLGRACEQQRRYDEAIGALQKAAQLSGLRSRYVASLGHAYSAAGRTKQALRLLGELKRRLKKKYVPASDLALIYAGLRKRTQTLEWLNKAYQEHDSLLPFVRSDPRFAWLRPDPRFQKFLRRLNLSS